MEQWDNYFPPLNLWNYSLSWQWFEDENLSDGDDQVSTGQQVTEWTARESRTRRIGVTQS